MPSDSPQSLERVPAPFSQGAEEFQRGVDRFIAAQINEHLNDYIVPENRLRLHHGRSWGTTLEDVSEHSGSLKERSAETTVSFESIAQNDLKVLVDFLTTLAQGMASVMTRDIFATVSDAAESSGNVVSQREAGSPARAFLEMLKKIEFGVNARGEVTLPAFHAAPRVGKKMLEDLNAQGPEFRAEIQRIKREKTEAALERERERLGRYRS